MAPRRRGGGGGGGSSSPQSRGGKSGGAATGRRASSSTGRGRGGRKGSESGPVLSAEDAWFDVDGGDDVAEDEVEEDTYSALEAAASVATAPAILTSGPPPQAFPLTAAPLYPNSLKWSEENLIAIAAGHMVTILNPSSLSGPRSFVSVQQKPSLDFGTLSRDDLKTSLLLPLTLVRDSRVVVRSMDWSPIGVASNGGCLLAVATTDNRVKLHSPPICDFRAEWVEVGDLSELMFSYCMKYQFMENETIPNSFGTCMRKRAASEELSTGPKKRQRNDNFEESTPLASQILQTGSLMSNSDEVFLWDGQTSLMSNQILDKQPMNDVLPEDVIKILQQKEIKKGQLQLAGNFIDNRKTSYATPQTSKKKNTKVKDGDDEKASIYPVQYMARNAIMTPLVVSWSPKCYIRSVGGGGGDEMQSYIFLAVGTKSGFIGFWCLMNPQSYSLEKPLPPEDVRFIGFLRAHDSWVTVLHWASYNEGESDSIVLATGSSDGSIKLWLGDSLVLLNWHSNSQFLPWSPMAQVVNIDNIPVTVMALKILSEGANILLVAGKGSGSITAWECTKTGSCSRKAFEIRAHEQVVMGLSWTSDGRFIYSCGQDNFVYLWNFCGNQLIRVESELLASDAHAMAPDLPSSALESYFGLALSPGNLALAMVRGIAADVVDPMYQSRSQKGIVQLIWVGSLDDSKMEVTAGSEIITNWEQRVLSALCHLERSSSLILWDTVTVTLFLKGMCRNIQASENAVLAKWFSMLLPVGGDGDACSWSVSDLKTYLLNMSCRCLQMMVVIYRRVILEEMRFELNSQGIEALQASGGRSQLTEEQQLWLDHLWCIEQELRERLMILTLLTALWWNTPQQCEQVQALNDVENRLSSALLMADWIVINTSKVSPQLLQLAMQVQKAFSKRRAVSEVCSYCQQPVGLDYLEYGYCRSTSTNGNWNHRLNRCSTSLQICPTAPLWYCNCCARNAFVQSPDFFFNLASREEIERLPSIMALHPLVPRCPFCGILMQRYVPEFFLSPSLV